MDINELLHREQVSLSNAARASCPASRWAHNGLAVGYGVRLRAAGFPHRISGGMDPIPDRLVQARSSV